MSTAFSSWKFHLNLLIFLLLCSNGLSSNDYDVEGMELKVLVTVSVKISYACIRMC